MRRFLGVLTSLSLLLVPALALANVGPQPQDAGSPEPLAAILLAMGAVPAYLLYRWGEREKGGERGREE